MSEQEAVIRAGNRYWEKVEDVLYEVREHLSNDLSQELEISYEQAWDLLEKELNRT